MANRIFVCAVVALWLGSMSWLMVDKILPSYWDGERPIAAGYENNVPVGWRVSWGDRQVGHAVSVRIPGTLNTTNVESRVKLTDVPLLELVPPLMRHVVGDIGSMKFEAKTWLEFDSLDNFTKFVSSVSINDITPVLKMAGTINGSFLELNVTFGEVSYKPKVPVSDRGVLSEALFPDAKLPFMYTGRRWQEEVYNPFSSPSAPIETLDVEVTGIENIDYEGEHIRAFRVESLAPAVTGVPDSARLQSVAWVKTDDGTVLRQDVFIANSKLRFERMSTEEATAIHGKLEEEAREKYRRVERGPGGRRYGGDRGDRGEGGHRPWRGWDREPAEADAN